MNHATPIVSAILSCCCAVMGCASEQARSDDLIDGHGAGDVGDRVSPDTVRSDTREADTRETDARETDAREVDASEVADGDVTPPLAWSECESTIGPGAEGLCAVMSVPLDHDAPEGPRVDVFVRHILSRVDARAQLVFLAGGPGEASHFAGFHQLWQADDRLHAFVVEMRGTGASTRMGTCAELEDLDGWLDADAIDACVGRLEARWGDGLAGFSTTEDAHDVAALVRQVRQVDVPLYLVGVSYGTARALRVLELYPDLVDGVILDSLVPPGWSAVEATIDYDDGVRAVMAECGRDTFCAGRLGAEPLGFVEALMVKLAAGHCPTEAGYGLEAYRAIFAASVAGTFLDRLALPALLHRIDRCSPADEEAIVFRATAMGVFEPTPVDYLDVVLHLNVVANDLSARPELAPDVIADREAGAIAVPDLARRYRSVVARWPVGPLRGAAQTPPPVDVPMLVLAGAVDARTPAADAVAFGAHYAAAGQGVVVIPRAEHNVIKTTSCARRAIATFIADPEAPVALSDCDSLPPPWDFEGRIDATSMAFGVASWW